MAELGIPNLKKITLPSSDGQPVELQSWVMLNSTPQIGELLVPGVEDAAERGLIILARVIKQWNFTLPDAEGKQQSAEITAENVRKLPPDDFWTLFQEVTAGRQVDATTQEEKKTS